MFTRYEILSVTCMIRGHSESRMGTFGRTEPPLQAATLFFFFCQSVCAVVCVDNQEIETTPSQTTIQAPETKKKRK